MQYNLICCGQAQLRLKVEMQCITYVNLNLRWDVMHTYVVVKHNLNFKVEMQWITYVVVKHNLNLGCSSLDFKIPDVPSIF